MRGDVEDLGAPIRNRAISPIDNPGTGVVDQMTGRSVAVVVRVRGGLLVGSRRVETNLEISRRVLGSGHFF